MTLFSLSLFCISNLDATLFVNSNSILLIYLFAHHSHHLGVLTILHILLNTNSSNNNSLVLTTTISINSDKHIRIQPLLLLSLVVSQLRLIPLTQGTTKGRPQWISRTTLFLLYSKLKNVLRNISMGGLLCVRSFGWRMITRLPSRNYF